MISAFVLSQVFAGLTFILGLSAYQCKNRNKILILLGLAQVSASIHFFLLGSIVGGWVVALSAARFFTGIYSSKEILKYTFIVTTITVGLSALEYTYDIMPIVAGVLGTLAAFTTDEKRMRHFLLGGTVAILTYNILIFSPVAVLSGLFFLGSSLLGYWRFYIKSEV